MLGNALKACYVKASGSVETSEGAQQLYTLTKIVQMYLIDKWNVL